MRIINSIEDIPPNYTEILREYFGDEFDHSKWDRREIIHMSDSKVHVDTKFTRYRKDGSVMGSYYSLYVFTKENGQWKIKMRSSFAS